MPSVPKAGKPTDLAQDWYRRAKAESASKGLFSDGQPDLTLDEARAEFAQAISRTVQRVAADRFGPLVGTLTETTIVATLKGLEDSAQQVKIDTTAALQEIFDRIITGKSKN